MIFQSENFVIDDIGNDCMLFINSRKSLNDDEYDAMIRFYRSLGTRLGDYRALVLTDGAGPTAKQREQQLKEFTGLKNIVTVVISDAVTVRFRVASIGLIVKTIRTFDLKEFSSALTFLGIKEAEHARIRSQLIQIPQTHFRTLDGVLGR